MRSLFQKLTDLFRQPGQAYVASKKSDGSASWSVTSPAAGADRDDAADGYFATMTAMREAVRSREYAAAAVLARQNLREVPGFVRSTVVEFGEFSLSSIPCLEEGGTMLALAGDEEGLAELRRVTRSLPELERWRAGSLVHQENLFLFRRIEEAVHAQPDVEQTALRELLGVEDGRRVANLVQWLDKGGRIVITRSGRTYRLWPPGEAPRPAPEESSEPISMPRVTRRGKVAVRVLELNGVPYVPLPKAPLRWEERAGRPGPKPVAPAADTFEIRDSDEWRITSIENVPAAERPDTAYRQLYAFADGVVLIDDLGKAAAFPSAPASALVFDRNGAQVAAAPLAHNLYRTGVNALGRGVVVMSRDCVLHAYDSSLAPLFDTPLRETGEVRALSRRCEIGAEELRNHLRTVSLAHDNSRVLVTGVDEAWCSTASGEALWSVRMPLKEGWRAVATEPEHYGTSREVQDALAVMGLTLPVTPTEVKQRYRALAKEWHPDLNPNKAGTEERMKALTAAAELITGVDLTEERQAVGVRYVKPLSESRFAAGGFEFTITTEMSGGATFAADWIYAASFAGRSHGAYLAAYSGRIVQVDDAGRPVRVYDIGSVPRRIIDTGDYLYFLTDTRLYVLKDECLHAVVDTTDAGDLIVAETGFALLEKKRMRWFAEDGTYAGAVVTRNPLRRVYWSRDHLVIETRQRRARIAGALAWWEKPPDPR